jgi:hypothetical protein
MFGGPMPRVSVFKKQMQIFMIGISTICSVLLFQNCSQQGELKLGMDASKLDDGKTSTFYIYKNSNSLKLIPNTDFSLKISETNQELQGQSANSQLGNEVVYELASGPELSALTAHGKIQAIDSKTGAITYSPQKDFVGEDLLTISKITKNKVPDLIENSLIDANGQHYVPEKQSLQIKIIVHEKLQNQKLEKVDPSLINYDIQSADKDLLPPLAPKNFDDGKSLVDLSKTPEFKWTHSVDAGPENNFGTGVSSYEIAIGTAPGLTDVADWKDIGYVNSLSLNLTLISDKTYYSSLRAVDFNGQKSEITKGDGWIAYGKKPPMPPTAFEVAKFGAALNQSPVIKWVQSTIPSADSAQRSAIAYYEISVGTTAGGTDVLDWKNIGNVSTITLTYANPQYKLYYPQLRAVDVAGLKSTNVGGISWQGYDKMAIVDDTIGRHWLFGSTSISCADYMNPSDPAKKYIGATGDGAYLIDPDGPTGATAPFKVFCDMTTEGGGWTLAIKIAPKSQQFLYSSALWGNAAVLNESDATKDLKDAKFLSYSTVKGRTLRGCMDNTCFSYQGSIASTPLDYLNGPQVTINGHPGINPSWTSQSYSKMFGLNMQLSCDVLRFGYVANNENNLSCMDTAIGFGGGAASGQRSAGELCMDAGGCQNRDFGGTIWIK